MALFRLFKKNPVIKYLEFEDIGSWLETYSSKNEVGVKLGILKREILSKTTKVKELLHAFNLAKPKNIEGLPQRSVEAIYSNKEKFIEKIEDFLSKAHIPDKPDDFKEFMILLSDTLVILEEEIQKHYFSIREHFPEDVILISRKLKELDSVVVSGISSLENSAIEKISSINELVRNYYEYGEEIKKLRAELEELTNKRAGELDRKSRIEEKIGVIKSSPGYRDFEALERRFDELKFKEEDLIGDLKKELVLLDSFFYKVNGKKEKLLASFSKAPSDVLMKKGDLLVGKIDVAMKKAKKNGLQQTADSKIIKNFMKSFISIDEERRGLKIRLSNNSANLNVREHEGWIKTIDDSIRLTERKMEKIENALERLSLSLIKQKIRKLLKELDSSIELK